jgi:hypothetical protein
VLRQVFYQQWRLQPQLVLVLAVGAFALPLMAAFYQPGSLDNVDQPVAPWLIGARQVGTLLPFLAALGGLVAASLTWSPDINGRFVYALSLPVPRPRFVMLRFAAGAILALIPAAGIGAGSAIGALAITLPEGIHAYPVALTVRFALATLTCFAIGFALIAAGKRVAYIVLGSMVAMVMTDVVLSAFEVRLGLTELLFKALADWPGPFSILRGRWALFDV